MAENKPWKEWGIYREGESRAREGAQSDDQSTGQTTDGPIGQPAEQPGGHPVGRPVDSFPPIAQRVKHIMRLMATGQWVRGETGPELATQWGMSKGEVNRCACEASRRIYEHLSDQEVASICRAHLYETLELAKECEPKQLSAGVAAAKLIFESHGMLTQHHRVSVDQPRNETQALSELMADPVWGPKIRAYVTTGEPVPELPAGEKDEESE